jgi:hypothetical protein
MLQETDKKETKGERALESGIIALLLGVILTLYGSAFNIGGSYIANQLNPSSRAVMNGILYVGVFVVAIGVFISIIGMNLKSKETPLPPPPLLHLPPPPPPPPSSS